MSAKTHREQQARRTVPIMGGAGRVLAGAGLTLIITVSGFAVAGSASPTRAWETVGHPEMDFHLDLPAGAEYVALGDSYSSSGSKSTVLPGDVCLRSADDLGHVVARELQPASFTDRACAGGTIASLTRPAAVPGGWSPQVNVVGPHTRLVTVTVGANSLEFGAVITHCFKAADESGCRASAVAALPGSAEYESVRAHYRAAIDLVRSRAADDVLVVLVGYLPIHAESGPVPPACLAETGDRGENVAWWRIFHRALTGLVEDVAADTGAVYVAVPSDHPVCAPEPYVAPERANDVAAGIDAYGLHPTTAGQSAVGRLVAERVRAALAAPRPPAPTARLAGTFAS